MKRVRFWLLGKCVSMLEEDWEKLKEGFDLRNKIDIGSHSLIKGICPLCWRTKRMDAKDRNNYYVVPNCELCTFFKFETAYEAGCASVLNELVNQQFPRFRKFTDVMSRGVRMWKREDAWVAAKMIKFIHDKMLEIEARRRNK